ncbi:MAG: sigma-70 family RNA polymerase sigma factor [Phaeodactylibacter sp.]|nr:sigma-70 family RNA polymerase sigma factor [Phaeodactylibacter sp.]
MQGCSPAFTHLHVYTLAQKKAPHGPRPIKPSAPGTVQLTNPHNLQTTLAAISDDQILVLLEQPRTYERGFRLLMEKYQERLYWHIRRMVYDHEDANDVIQDCFLKVYRNIHNFEKKSKLYTWLYRIATNEAITFLKKKQRRSAAPIDDGENNLANGLRADAYFDADEAQARLQRALEALPEKQRLVFNMRYFEELSYKDISEVLDTSVGALKASYHHAVKKIEAFFKAEL